MFRLIAESSGNFGRPALVMSEALFRRRHVLPPLCSLDGQTVKKGLGRSPTNLESSRLLLVQLQCRSTMRALKVDLTVTGCVEQADQIARQIEWTRRCLNLRLCSGRNVSEGCLVRNDGAYGTRRTSSKLRQMNVTDGRWHCYDGRRTRQDCFLLSPHYQCSVIALPASGFTHRHLHRQ